MGEDADSNPWRLANDESYDTDAEWFQVVKRYYLLLKSGKPVDADELYKAIPQLQHASEQARIETERLNRLQTGDPRLADYALQKVNLSRASAR